MKPDIFGEVKANCTKQTLELRPGTRGESLTTRQQRFPNRSNPNHGDEQARQTH